METPIARKPHSQLVIVHMPGDRFTEYGLVAWFGALVTRLYSSGDTTYCREPAKSGWSGLDITLHGLCPDLDDGLNPAASVTENHVFTKLTMTS